MVLRLFALISNRLYEYDTNEEICTLRIQNEKPRTREKHLNAPNQI